VHHTKRVYIMDKDEIERVVICAYSNPWLANAQADRLGEQGLQAEQGEREGFFGTQYTVLVGADVEIEARQVLGGNRRA
jgi:hypothetical protein